MLNDSPLDYHGEREDSTHSLRFQLPVQYVNSAMRPWRRAAIALTVSGVYIRCDFETPARSTALLNRNMGRGALILALFVLAAHQRLEARVPASPGAPKTFVDMTPDELAKQIPELKHLVPAQSQDMLPTILERVGVTVADFFDNFSNTTCTENIVSAVDTSIRSPEGPYNAKFNYVALVKPGADKTRLQEFRTGSGGEPIQPQGAIVTAGFVALLAHFHPDYQRDSRFRYLGREVVKAQSTYVIAFAQQPGVARMASREEFGLRTKFVFVQGVAWIDPASFRILRLQTDLEQPEPNIGLQSETTEVEYSEVTFKEAGKTLWLPREVAVRVQLRRFSYHNWHRYSDYRLFVVRTEEKQKSP